MVMHIRVVTPIITTGWRTAEDAKILGSEGVEVDFSWIEAGTASIESNFEVMLSQPATIARIIEAEREGVDAVVIDCMADPGLAGARECVSIPVLGPMQTAMGVAAMMGHKFGILSVLQRVVPMFETQAAIYGHAAKLASIRSIDIPVLELEKDLDATKRALIAEAKKAVIEDGADYLIFGCTGLFDCSDAVRAGLLKEGIDVPVIDPVPTAVNVAAAMVRSKLPHSKRAYQPPPHKAISGYAHIGIGTGVERAAAAE